MGRLGKTIDSKMDAVYICHDYLEKAQHRLQLG